MDETLGTFFDIAYALISSTPVTEQRYQAWAYFYGYQDACNGYAKASPEYILDMFCQSHKARLEPCTQAYLLGYSAMSKQEQTHGVWMQELASVIRQITTILAKES